MSQKPRRPRDTNQLAKLIVDISTGGTEDAPAKEPSPKATAGRLGGIKGGKARADNLTPEQLSEIGRAGAAARWKK